MAIEMRSNQGPGISRRVMRYQPVGDGRAGKPRQRAGEQQPIGGVLVDAVAINIHGAIKQLPGVGQEFGDVAAHGNRGLGESIGRRRRGSANAQVMVANQNRGHPGVAGRDVAGASIG